MDEWHRVRVTMCASRVRVYVSVCVCMYMCMCVCARACAYVYVYICMCVFVCVCTWTHTDCVVVDKTRFPAHKSPFFSKKEPTRAHFFRKKSPIYANNRQLCTCEMLLVRVGKLVHSAKTCHDSMICLIFHRRKSSRSRPYCTYAALLVWADEFRSVHE